MNGQVNVKDMDITTLKSLAYDEIQKLEIAQRNLRVINEEIARKGVPSESVQSPEAKKE